MHRSTQGSFPERGEGLVFFLFYGEKGRGGALGFLTQRLVPTIPSGRARCPAGVAERAPMAIQLEPTDTRIPHQQEIAGWPLSPTISCWPARPGGCVKQIATLGQNWQPRRTTAGPALHLHPQGIEHGRSGRVSHVAGKTDKQNSPLLFFVEKTLEPLSTGPGPGEAAPE